MRRHTHRACDRCRRRKIKCDGRTPACDKCQISDITCEYALPRSKRGPKFRSGLRSTSRIAEVIATPISPESSVQCAVLDSASSDRISGEPRPLSFDRGLCDEHWSRGHTAPTPLLKAPQVPHWIETTSSQKIFGQYAAVPGLDPNPPAQRTACRRSNPAQETHASLITEVEGLGLSLRDIVQRCIDLSVQWGFPIAGIVHPSTLQKHIDVLSPSFGQLSAPTSESWWQGAYERELTQLESLRYFTLLTAICAKVCAQAPPGLLDWGPVLIGPFLRASRQMLALFEDYDAVRPDSKSLVIRTMQAVTLHRLGQNRLSRYVLGQALRLAIDMCLSDKASYASLDRREAQLRENMFWLLYTSDKSASMLNGTATMLHDSLPRIESGDGEDDAATEDTETQVLLLEGFQMPFYVKAFEKQLWKGISLSRRVWVLGSDISRDMTLLFISTSGLSDYSDASRSLDAFQQKTMQSYLTFCSLLDHMPPWLLRPEFYSDPEATESVVTVRRNMFWAQKADLVVTYYCLRLRLVRQAFEQRCPALLGLTANQDMLDLKVTELARDLLTAIEDLPYDTLYISGEPLVEKLRQFGVTLLEIGERSSNGALSSRARRLLGILLDKISRLDSKASDNLACAGQA